MQEKYLNSSWVFSTLLVRERVMGGFMPGSKMNVSGEGWGNGLGKVINWLRPPAAEQEYDVPVIPVDRTPSPRAVEANQKSKQMIERAVKLLIDSLGGSMNDLKSTGGRALVNVIFDIVTNQYASFLCEYYQQDGLHIEFTQEEHPKIQHMYINPKSCEITQEEKSDIQLMQDASGVEERVQEKLSRAAWRFGNKRYEYEAAAIARLTPKT